MGFPWHWGVQWAVGGNGCEGCAAGLSCDHPVPEESVRVKGHSSGITMPSSAKQRGHIYYGRRRRHGLRRSFLCCDLPIGRSYNRTVAARLPFACPDLTLLCHLTCSAAARHCERSAMAVAAHQWQW
jgi:hypothetical protein